jgi:hypothetical protein
MMPFLAALNKVWLLLWLRSHKLKKLGRQKKINQYEKQINIKDTKKRHVDEVTQVYILTSIEKSIHSCID